MNKERAINILLKFAKDTCESINIRKEAGYQEEIADDLTSAILFLEKDIQQNKKIKKPTTPTYNINPNKGNTSNLNSVTLVLPFLSIYIRSLRAG